MLRPQLLSQFVYVASHEWQSKNGGSIHYNKSDFFQGSKPLKKALKNLEKKYFENPIDP